MGAQMSFYIDSETKRGFMEYIYSLGGALMRCKERDGAPCFFGSPDEAAVSDEWLFFIAFPENKDGISLKPWGQIDQLNSDVIEFSPSAADNEKKQIHEGRIWYERFSFNGSEKKLKSEKTDALFNDLRKWLKKHTKYIPVEDKKRYVTEKALALVNEGYVLK